MNINLIDVIVLTYEEAQDIIKNKWVNGLGLSRFWRLCSSCNI